jgi:SAM-dependent methyltransferase
MISERDYAEEAVALGTEAKVLDGLHAYFVQHCPRLYQSCRLFHLLQKDLGDVLEIGPFYGYTPFLLRRNAASYTVLEGDDPAAFPLKPLYQKRGIAVHYTDLFELFGPSHSATHVLTFDDASFDTILCWETLEHFGFNPVKLVRELHRVLKPGGKVSITVPNRASVQNILALICGRLERVGIDGYYTYEDYTSNGKKAFYGFHWREYSRGELAHLFTRAGFTVVKCSTFVAHQVHAETSVVRQMARWANCRLAGMLPRYGTNVYLEAAK